MNSEFDNEKGVMLLKKSPCLQNNCHVNQLLRGIGRLLIFNLYSSLRSSILTHNFMNISCLIDHVSPKTKLLDAVQGDPIERRYRDAFRFFSQNRKFINIYN